MAGVNASASETNLKRNRKTNAAIPLKERLRSGSYKPATSNSNSSKNAVVKSRNLFSPQKVPKPAKAFPKSTDKPQPADVAPKSTYIQRAFKQRGANNPSLHIENFDFMKDPEQLQQLKKESDDFLNKLFNEKVDCDDVVVFNESQVKAKTIERLNSGADFAPLLSNHKAADYGFIFVKTKSRYGPLINTRGIMILIFINAQDDKVTYQSFNLKDKKPVVCLNQVHILVLPDDVFVLHNNSSSMDAQILVISCSRGGKPINYAQHLNIAHQVKE